MPEELTTALVDLAWMFGIAAFIFLVNIPLALWLYDEIRKYRRNKKCFRIEVRELRREIAALRQEKMAHGSQ